MSVRRIISNTFSVSTLQDGVNAILADLDNEMDSITCSNEGKVTTGQSVQTNVAMYYGTTKLQSTIAVYNGSYQYTSGVAHDGITVTINNTTGNVLVYFGVSSSYVRSEKETFRIRLTATVDGVNVARDLYFVVNCIRGTAVYRLVPSVSQVVLKKDGSYEPTGTGYVTCAVVKTMNGVESTPDASEYVLTYILDGGDETTYPSQGIRVDTITSTLVFKLRKTSGGSTTLLDQETIPLVVDGEDGENGDDAHEINPNILVDTLEFKDSSKWFNLHGVTDGEYNGRVCWKSTYADVIESQTYVRMAEQQLCDSNLQKLAANTWYTLSVYCRGNSEFSMGLLQAGGYIDATYYFDGVEYTYSTSSSDLRGVVNLTGAWTRHVLTFKTKTSISTSLILFASFRIINVSSGDYAYICMPKLELGEYATAYMANDEDLVGAKGADGQDGADGHDGQDGQRGKVGRFFYYAGVFDQNSTSPSFPINDAQAPYFMTGNNFHVFNPEENPSGGSMTMAEMWAATESPKSFDRKPWTVMTDDFKYLITEAIFGKYAQFGSAIINGDWMLSTNGKIGNTAYDDGALWNGIPAYTLFNPLFPKGVGSASIALLKTSTTQRWSSGWDTMTETFMLNQYNTYIVEVTGHTTSSSVSAGIRLKFGDGNTDGTNNLNLGTFSGTSSQTLWSVVTVPSVCTDCRLTCGLSASGTAYIERITIRSTNIVPVTRASSLTSSYNDITNLMTLAKGVLYAVTVNLSSSGSTSHLQLYYPDSSTSVAETSGTGSQLTVRFSRTDAQTYARFRLQAKSTGSVTVTSITITADSRVSPIAFAPNYCVDLRRGDGFFKGVVTANLMYSSTQQITGDDSVTLNPFLDMCDTFLIKDISDTKNIYLPLASDYDGLEYSFIYGVFANSSYTYKVCYINRSGNESIFVPQTSSQTLVSPTRFTMPPNTIVKLKAIAGAWYVLQGLES